MDIRPIFSALRRHRLVMGMLILEIALTCAIVCNSVFLIMQNLQRMNLPSGIAEHQLVVVQMASIRDRPDADARAQANLASLRQIPGVRQVALVDKMPFMFSGNNSDIKLRPDQPQPSLSAGLYFGENLLSAFGARLIAGRMFHADEYLSLDRALRGLHDNNVRDLPRVAIVTRAMAQRLWPGQNALGKTFYIGKDIQMHVVGVLAQLARPNSLQRGVGFSWVVPIRMNADEGGYYVIRSAPRDRARVLADAVARLKQHNPGSIVMAQRSYDRMRAEYFSGDRAMAGTLIAVCLALLVITALGIGGLASFWVAQRRRTIGVRRALGATRGDILRYFQTENFLIVGFGIALGIVLAYGLSLLLMAHYELPRLPFSYLPAGALILWCVGQLAVLGPALRAAAVPPVVATRSV